jgi:predicted dehydrogenase
LKQINVWCQASRPGGSTEPAPIPSGLNYERWIGPARFTPHTQDKCSDDAEKKTWWFNCDYALGFIAGWGVHPLDIALWGYPAMMQGAMEVQGNGVFPKEGACDTAVAWEVDFAFAGGVRMNYRGTRNHFTEALPMNDLTAFARRYGKIASHGTAFEGTDGWILVDRTGLRSSRATLEPLGAGDTPFVRSPGHVRNFVDAVKGRGTTVCPIEDAVQADILCHLSDIAARLGRKLKWDPAQEQFPGDPEANRKLNLRPMRKPWQMT